MGRLNVAELLAALVDSGVSAAEIAHMAGASASQVTRWRSGEHGPNAEHMVALVELAETHAQKLRSRKGGCAT